MRRTQRWRARAFGPLLSWLAARGVLPGHVTAASLVAGLAAAALLPVWAPGALGLLVLHVLLDGIDGPLARAMGRDSNRGSFVDTTVDQVVVAAVALSAIHMGHATAWLGGVYVFVYTVVVFFAMWRAAMSAPYSWVIRPRFVVYAWLVIELYVWPGSLDILLAGSVAVLGWKAWTGFRAIERLLPGPRRRRSSEEE